MANFLQAFVRITAWIPQMLVFRTKVIYEDAGIQNRRIHGPAILISNHTAVYDYAQMLFLFWNRTLRYQMAEVLFRKKLLGPFLKLMGGIYIDRDSKDLGFVGKSASILQKGGVVGIFPEGRLPLKDETPPIRFLPGAAFLSISSGVKVIPVWTDGQYFSPKRAHAVIGVPMDPREYIVPGRPEKENIAAFTEAMRQKVIKLRKLADE